MPFSCPSLSSILSPSLSHRHLILFLCFICSRLLKKLQSQNMAACGSLEHIFDKPLSESPAFLDSLSPWKHIRSMKPLHDSSFNEIFGELHFNENLIQSSLSSSSSSESSDSNSYTISAVRDSENKGSCSSAASYSQKRQYGDRESFSSMNSESLSMCTEGLGFESFDDVDDLLKHDVCNDELEKNLRRNSEMENHRIESKVLSRRRSGGTFPPPISCIGRSGKPWVCFKSYREDGRFILKEIRIPTQEFLHACREDGRLKLQFIQSDDEILDEDDEDEDEDEDDDEESIEEQRNVETRCNFHGNS